MASESSFQTPDRPIESLAGGDTRSPSEKKADLRKMLTTGVRTRSRSPSKKRQLASAPDDDDEAETDPELRGSTGGEPFTFNGDQNEALRKLDRTIRWQSFLYHSHYFYDDEIKKIYGPNITADHTLYRVARTKFLDNMKAYKGQVLRALKKHVNDLMHEPQYRDLIGMRDEEELCGRFKQAYSNNGFMACWAYMREYVDPNATEEQYGVNGLGIYYTKAIYVNLCAQVKRWIDAKGTPAEAGVQKELLAFYDKLCVRPEFDDVSKLEFVQQTSRSRGDRTSSGGSQGMDIVNQRFRSLGAPPARRGRVTDSGSPLAREALTSQAQQLSQPAVPSLGSYGSAQVTGFQTSNLATPLITWQSGTPPGGSGQSTGTPPPPAAAGGRGQGTQPRRSDRDRRPPRGRQL